MRTCVAILLLLLLSPLAGLAASPAIPEPAELEPDVQFWMRVYSEITTNEGYIHDQWNLTVIYQTLHFDKEQAPAARERLVDAEREHYRAILRRLGSGAAPQDEDEQRSRGRRAARSVSRDRGGRAAAGAQLPGAGQLATGDHGLQSRRRRHAPGTRSGGER